LPVTNDTTATPMRGVFLSYKALDQIADAYIPLLAITLLLTVIILFFKMPEERKVLGRTFIYSLLLVVISYGLMFLDKRFHLWPAADLDYSTHTAVSMALVIPLCLLLRRYQVIFILSLVAYIALMLYQQYHSVPDILTTGVVIALCGFVIYRWLFSAKKA